MVISIVVGALNAIADRLLIWLSQLLGKISKVELQKNALLDVAQVLRRILILLGLW